MLAIKLQRIGKKHQPAYRVVVQEKRTKLNGRYTEDVGWFNPLQNTQEIKRDRVEYWMNVGAKPTDTVWNLLVRAGIITGPKRAVHKVSKKKKEESEPKAEEKPATPATS